MFHHEVLFKMNKKCEYHFRRACLLEAVDFAYKSSFNSDIFFFSCHLFVFAPTLLSQKDKYILKKIKHSINPKIPGWYRLTAYKKKKRKKKKNKNTASDTLRQAQMCLFILLIVCLDFLRMC